MPYQIDTQNFISGVPTFVNPTAGAGPSFDASAADWHLTSECSGTSIGFNQGTDALANDIPVFGDAFNLPITDLDGNARISCSVIDIGPYELKEYKQGVIASNLIDSISICSGETIGSYLNSDVCTSPMSSYQWQEKKAGSSSFTNITGATNSTLSLLANASQDKSQYRLKVVNQECLDSLYTNEGRVDIKTSPQIDLGADTSLINNESIVLKDAGSYPNYLWDNNSTSSTRTIQNDTQNLGDKLFWLEVTAINGCKARDSIIITFKKTNSVKQFNKTEIGLYPNPTRGRFKLSLPAEGEVSISNLSGKLLWKQTLNKGGWEVEQTNLPKGIYLLQWQGKGTQSSTLRFVIE